MPTPDQIRSALDAYVDGFNTGDKEAWLAAFADNARQTDPVGTPENVGRVAIAGFWDRAAAMGDSIAFDMKDVIVCGDQAAMVWTINLKQGEGGMSFDGVDIFTIDDDGKISEIKAYWEMSRARQIG